jgi:restriction system protein
MENSSKNVIPDFQTIMLPLLKYFGDQKEHSTSELVEHISNVFHLTEEQRRDLLPSGTQTTIYNRVIWAKTYLKKAGLIESTVRPYFKITERGLEILNNKPIRIDMKFLEQFPEYQEFKKLKKEDKKIKEEENKLLETRTPEELVRSGYKIILDTIKSDILSNIKNCSPKFFEKLVVDLLIKMGYGGSLEDAGRAIGRSGDGGIDGIIKEDKLGLDFIYIQAKRWDGVVGRPEIHKFVGALTGRQANKGVFITTSKFTNDARDFVIHLDKKVVLIDGEQLAQLMLDYDIGVTKIETYEIKRIDNDYFTEE